MMVAMLALAATLVILFSPFVASIRERRLVQRDESVIATPKQLDIAIAKQRAERLIELERRVTERSYWPEAVIGVAAILLVIALVEDRFSHPWIVSIVLPAVGAIVGARVSRRRLAQRELEQYRRDDNSFPAA
jgi:peptidoglycan/LPS O-acetylase OafA/YrhL